MTIKKNSQFFFCTIANVFPTMIRLVCRHLDNGTTLHLVTVIMQHVLDESWDVNQS